MDPLRSKVLLSESGSNNNEGYSTFSRTGVSPSDVV